MGHLPHGSDGERAQNPLRVIVADDDPLARRVVRDALEAGGIVTSLTSS
jgi:CheY-like chemotaxis protein